MLIYASGLFLNIGGHLVLDQNTLYFFATIFEIIISTNRTPNNKISPGEMMKM